MREACCDSLMTVAIAPHQVYGPRDKLFVLNFLKAAEGGLLRVFACKRTGYVSAHRMCMLFKALDLLGVPAALLYSDFLCFFSACAGLRCLAMVTVWLRCARWLI